MKPGVFAGFLLLLAILPEPGCGVATSPNLVLISLDTVRADHCSLYGYGLPTTPMLEIEASNGVVFDRAYATTPTTGPSHATLFTGLMPQTHRVKVNGDRLQRRCLTLAEALAAEGYQTAGIASSFVLHETFGLARGFDYWRDDFSLEGAKHQSGVWMDHVVPAGFDRRADKTTSLALDWMQEIRDPGRPFFLFVHYFEPHGPYVPPENWLDRFREGQGGEVSDQMISAYDAGLAYTDDEVGRFLKALDDFEVSDDTLVVITADHGEGLMSHGAMAHGPHLYDEAVKIPLVFRFPRQVPGGRRIGHQVGLQDLMPTILDLLGVDRPASKTDGHSFADVLLSSLGERAQHPVFLFRGAVRPGFVGEQWIAGERYGVIDGRMKLLTSGAEDDELFDRTADPMERQNLALNRKDDVRRLKKVLEPLIAAGQHTERGERQLSSEERRALETLGYLQ